MVEDEEKIGRAIKTGLSQEGWAVDLARDGESGLDLGLSEDYDVLGLDWMLPGISGKELCLKLRKAGKEIAVLMLTARSEVADRVEGLDSGADDYLTKPFAFEELVARIRALARRPRESLGEVLKVKDLSLDTVKKEVRRGNKSMKLSKREFSLLEYLMRNKGKTLEKGKIIEKVWDFDADVLPNTVEAHIASLRKKIDRGLKAKRSFIQTIRGFGYRLEGEEDV